MSTLSATELAAQAAAVDAAFAEGTDSPNPVRVFADLLGNAIYTATALNADPDYRSRELSLAITNLEQAVMWAEKAIK